MDNEQCGVVQHCVGVGVQEVGGRGRKVSVCVAIETRLDDLGGDGINGQQ